MPMLGVACILLAPTAQALQRSAAAPPTTTVSVDHLITRGQSFTGILRQYGVSVSDIVAWERAARQKADVQRLRTGRQLTLEFGPGGSLNGVRYDLDDRQRLVVERGARGRLRARRADIPARIRIAGARGTIASTFYQSAKQARLPDSVISRVVGLLNGEIDFDSDVQRGDRFRVLYEERTGLDGRPLPPGRILAADFVGRTRSAAAFLLHDDKGAPVHVDARGYPIEGRWLRYPVEFTRISSAFSPSRFHPILKRRRPHLGVDLVAPAGTPVHSIAAGTVVWAGWKGELGRHVEIDHGKGLVSAYSHLRRIDRAVRPGATVRQGRVIGWVGQTGLATGPHLHYALFDRGRYLNPLTAHAAPRSAPIDPYEFRAIRAALMQRLRTIPGPYRVVPSTAPVVLSALAQARQFGPVVLTL